MAHINVGVEPSDITIFMRAFYGADIGTSVEGMFQINAVSPDRLGTRPTQRRMETWRRTRESISAAGFASDPVVILEFVKDSHNSLTVPLQISKAAFIVAQKAEPFSSISALTGAKTDERNNMYRVRLLSLPALRNLTTRYQDISIITFAPTLRTNCFCAQR
jgi:hypothetical protein